MTKARWKPAGSVRPGEPELVGANTSSVPVAALKRRSSEGTGPLKETRLSTHGWPMASMPTPIAVGVLRKLSRIDPLVLSTL